MSGVGSVGAGRPEFDGDLGSVEMGGDAALAQVAGGARSLALGARGDDVKTVQTTLQKLGYSPGTPDGIFGRNTERAIAEFQRNAGLATTGVVDAQTLAALDHAAQVGAKKPAPGAAPRNDIVFLGMGDHAAYELQELRRAAATGGGAVVGVLDSRAGNDKLTFAVGGRQTTFDLTTREGVDAYVKTIGLSGAKAREVADIILNAGDDARDETAQIAGAFAQAERGERTIERLVLSGHSVGSGVWGDSNGMFDYDTLSKLTRAFPSAARQVEDFMVQGCYSGSEDNMELYRTMFPNLKTAFAYTGSAPGSYTGSVVHEKKWEAMTRGHDPSKVERGMVAGTRKGENVSTWNAVGGYQSAYAARPLAELRRELDAQRATFDRFFSGEERVQDTQQGPLRDYYNAVHRVLGSPELPEAEKAQLAALRDTTIKLNFYESNIRGRFQQAYAQSIASGYAAVGLPAPDFSRLTRKEALAQIAAFEAKLDAMPRKPDAALALRGLLVDGLRNLRAPAVPMNWV